MPLDPQQKALLDQIAALNLPALSSLSAELARQQYTDRMKRMPPGRPVANVEDRRIPGADGDIPLRIYRPIGAGALPALVYYHGGGWVIGNLDTHDAVCREITNAAGCVVVSVDYRLAPEHKFPVAAEDSFAATRWVAENAAELDIDPRRIAVGGDSAGGNLAAVVTQMARERGGPAIAFQLLVYPVTNFDFATPSYAENAEGYGLTADSMRWFWDQYLPEDGQGSHRHASPLQAEDLRRLPPALVITAEYDPLRDEGEAYAAKLRDAGVPVTVTRYDGVCHGFFGQSIFLDKAKLAVAEACAALREAFARQPV